MYVLVNEVLMFIASYLQNISNIFNNILWHDKWLIKVQKFPTILQKRIANILKGSH